MPHIDRFERNGFMKNVYAKMTFRLILISFLALMLIGCGESGSPGGGSGPGQTAAISLSLQSNNLPADGNSSTAIVVGMTDISGNPVVEGTSLDLTTTIGKFPNGQKSYRVRTSDETGNVSVSLVSENKSGEAKITAVSNKISQSTTLTFLDAKKVPAYITLGTSANTVKTDNSNSATITTVVLDADRAPVEGISVSFTTTSEDGTSGAGQISASSLLTDEDGKVEVQFSAGVGDKRNQIVTIEANVEGLSPKQIPIQVTGSYLTVSAEGETILEIGGQSSVLKISVRDAGNNPVFDAPVQISLTADSNGTINFDPPSGKTDIQGEFEVALTGVGVGNATAKVSSIGATATQSYTVDDPNKLFRIIEPSENLISIDSHTNQNVRVSAAGYEEITFVTTVGFWEENGKKVITKKVASGESSAVFSSQDSGTATIQVYPTAAPMVTDSMRVVISAPSSEASKIIFQSTSTVVQPSTEDVKNSVTLIAKVTNSNNQVVKNAPVLFSIVTPSGGGEYIFPAIALTDSSGTATSVFTSGSLVAGADGVKVKAELLNANDSDTISIIISGKAASLTIGTSTEVESINNDTAYRMPMSVLVTDANGSPVTQSSVSLNLWPSHYRTGFWEERKTVTINGVVITYCVPIVEGERPNEDVNKNLILDDGEDINQDGLLTPPSSASGSIPATVVTDENGLANFDLIYMKSSAVWIQNAMTASTVVSGTETLSTFNFVLPYSIRDADDCALSNSPFSFEEEDPEAASVSVSAGNLTIRADGTSTSVIRAFVSDTDGDPIIGQTVNFSTTLGSFFPGSSEVTNESGIAVITLKSGTFPGIAVVTAEAEGFTDQVEVTMTASEPDNIAINVIPDPVVPGSTATIIATLFDVFGNPIAGESLNIVIFENKTGGRLSAASTPTDVNGQAILTYTAGTIAGTDKIRVSLSSNQSIYQTGSIKVEALPFTVGTISLALPDEFSGLPADGISSVPVTATITDIAGNPVPKGVQVTFSTTLGTFPRGFSGTGGISSRVTIATAGDDGQAITSLVSGSMPGQAIVSATVPGSGLTQSITVLFTGGSVANIQLIAEKSILKANGVDQTIITALVKTADNQAIEGELVSFSTTGGTITTPFTTDASGRASATLTSGQYNGEAIITAMTQAGARATTRVIFQGISLTLEANPKVSFFNQADPDAVEITAVLEDAEGRPMEGEMVDLTLFSYFPDDPPPFNPPSLIGSFIDGSSYVTDIFGTATAYLVPNQAGIIYVKGDADVLGSDGSDVVEVVFNQYQILLSVNPGTIRVGETAEITASITENGVPKNNVTVFFSTSLGSLIGGISDVSGAGMNPIGEAKTIIQASSQSGIATLNAVAVIDGQELKAVTRLSIAGGNASKIVLKANPEVISTQTGTATITASMYDSNDQPAGNQKIYFRIVDGPGGGEYLTLSETTTNSSGQATVQMVAGSLPGSVIGDVIIEASSDPNFMSVIGQTNITIAGPVAKISVGINLEDVQTDEEEGHIEVGVSGIATDVNGNPVADGTQINFSVESIAFDEDRDNDRRIHCRRYNGQPCDGTEDILDLGVSWYSDDINQDGTMYSIGGIMAPSEDKNGNGILDPGEDLNGNGVMDPPQGVTIDNPKQTTNGIATTTMYYPMSYADNVKVRISVEAGGVTNFYDIILLCTDVMVRIGTCGLGY